MAKARTSRRVVVYRPKRRSYSRSRGSSGKIPLAVLAGFAPSVIWGVDAAAQGNFQAMFERLLASFTGYEYGQKKFTFMYLNYGLWPVLAGLLVHNMADWTGLNRMIAKTRLPIAV